MPALPRVYRKDIEFGAFNVLPVDGDLEAGHPELIGDHEQLDVEGPPFYVHHLEEDFGCLFGHQLEAALSVLGYEQSTLMVMPQMFFRMKFNTAEKILRYHLRLIWAY